MTEETLRLSKLLSERGICSRREADAFIAQGRVRVDGVVAGLGAKVGRHQTIELDPSAQRRQAGLVTVLLNKPVGFVSTQPEKGYRAAIELVVPANQDPQFPGPRLRHEHLVGLAAAGRLDIESKGLLVLTQSGPVARQLIGEDSEMEKEYLVRVTGDPAPDALARLRHGICLDGQELRPAEVEWLNYDQLRVVLHEGRKRQIRRMCEVVGLRVEGLKRVRIGKVMLGRLAEGMWRFLGEEERF